MLLPDSPILPTASPPTSSPTPYKANLSCPCYITNLISKYHPTFPFASSPCFPFGFMVIYKTCVALTKPFDGSFSIFCTTRVHLVHCILLSFLLFVFVNSIKNSNWWKISPKCPFHSFLHVLLSCLAPLSPPPMLVPGTSPKPLPSYRTPSLYLFDYILLFQPLENLISSEKHILPLSKNWTFIFSINSFP